ncbi:MAG: metallophosphoesterase family protein [Dehalococcoidales bacterium]|jgi:diadenosine tetraphosphatase ApaH/serine/threonine PP2A family protein phosphatase|nr:metallophosphoesterase family protein [Dehalococcoidales bacterium]MDD3264458.1 metallophosphoesterase family protein [Dehalococcoidales bacterium]MDD4322459.1 metallophosphoesterase family protein [Dehalococcoidales bacterium]MDD4793979.1 metallophosphoesterase family protein [Dehalococcoidales bacterium]MDD5122111.1 metallophosphoesterase family protein [Dehalococcoidales bacterium]
MRIAILADIHANLDAFIAVLRDCENRGGVEEYWFLGDVVNYGPDPAKCVEIMRRLKHCAVCGNHDLAAAGKISTRLFNPDAAAAMEWTIKQLNPQDAGFLSALEQTAVRGDFMLLHGSPRDPVWEYLISKGQAEENFSYFSSKYCFVGHSHEPLIFRLDENGHTEYVNFNEGIGQVIGDFRLIINPGSVGQPRDGDPRASYAILDSETSMIKLYRVTYDIGATQLKMVKANLPLRLVARLEKGM